MQRQEIYKASANVELGSIYTLSESHITIFPYWREYPSSNAGILKGFCLWKLCLFLQARNPSVPDIANKLIKPATRNNLTAQRNQYWKLVFDELGEINCTFTQDRLGPGNYALDHFIPHVFVSHDLMWNLIPISPVFNARKGDLLPDLDRHFDDFYQVQKNAFDVVTQHAPKNKWLEEYLSISGFQV